MDRLANWLRLSKLAGVMCALLIVASKCDAAPSAFNCSDPTILTDLESPQIADTFYFCAEDILFSKARKIRHAIEPTPPASKSYIAAAWEYLNLPDAKKSMRERCAANRTAIFVMGAPGSRRDELESKWLPLLDRECGHVRINLDRILKGVDGFDLGPQVWQAAINRMKGKDSTADVERCVKEELSFKLKLQELVYKLVGSAINELHSFVFESDSFVQMEDQSFLSLSSTYTACTSSLL